MTKFPDDRYLSPFDGRPRKLMVQATDEIYEGLNTSTYRRTFIRDVSPWMLRIALWAAGDENVLKYGWPMTMLRCIPAALALTVMVR